MISARFYAWCRLVLLFLVFGFPLLLTSSRSMMDTASTSDLDPSAYALAKLSGLFMNDQTKSLDFPDEFGGAWLEDDTLNVYLIGEDSKTVYQRLLSEYDSVAFTHLEFGSSQRFLICQEILRISSKYRYRDLHLYNFIHDYDANKIVIFSDQDAQTVLSAIQKLVVTETRNPCSSFLKGREDLKRMLRLTNVRSFIEIAYGTEDEIAKMAHPYWIYVDWIMIRKNWWIIALVFLAGAIMILLAKRVFTKGND